MRLKNEPRDLEVEVAAAAVEVEAAVATVEVVVATVEVVVADVVATAIAKQHPGHMNKNQLRAGC